MVKKAPFLREEALTVDVTGITVIVAELWTCSEHSTRLGTHGEQAGRRIYHREVPGRHTGRDTPTLVHLSHGP